MQPLPHRYSASATSTGTGNVTLSTQNCSPIVSAPPIEFDGPGDQWSPESLLMAAVADCFVLSFTAVAKASHFEWSTLNCQAEGVLDKVERAIQFTSVTVNATLQVASGTDINKATKLLQKAELHCLVSNSLSAEIHLNTQVLTQA